MTWREGSRAALNSRFGAVRVRPAHRDTLRSEPWPEQWLLLEWPESMEEPSKYWLSNLPPRATLKDLVHTAKARWLIERDYQELKQEIGLGHYEGRGWRGFHHHASLCIAAYGVQGSASDRRRALPFPPSGPLHPSKARATCATQRLPAARRRQSGLSGTCRTRSPRSTAVSRLRSSRGCRGARAACSIAAITRLNDTVTLSAH